MRPTDTQVLFVALEPEPGLAEQLNAHKSRTRAIVGPQLFLDHPPHLTVYLAAFRDRDRIQRDLENLRPQIAGPTTRLAGWQIFEADPLTGNTTFAYALAAQSQQPLRTIQATIIDALSAQRDPSATESRLHDRMHCLTSTQRICLLRYGFPYTGTGWLPHFTIASIRPPDWPRVWAEFRDQAPTGQYTCPRLQLYQLRDEQPYLITSLSLA